jgi:ubiquitin-protein ligase
LVTSTSPDDWTQWLAIATAIHNNWKNEMTGLSLNQILLGYELMLHSSEDTPLNNKATETWIKNMTEKRAQAIDAINRTAQGSQVILSQYKLGEQV